MNTETLIRLNGRDGPQALAAEARHGGRALTRQLARFAGPPVSRKYMSHGAETGAIDHVWSYYIDPSVRSTLYEGTPEQREARRLAWRGIARTAANGYDASSRPVFLTDAEAMLGWPIYREAMNAEVYGALWGQASSAEEVVLDTLAHCAGIRTPLTPSDDPIVDAGIANRPEA